MKLKGFTLAEVLITLTLIGVVATMTLPALVTNIQRQQAGPSLLKAIGVLDTANALVANERDLITFRAGCGNGYDACFATWVARQMTASPSDGAAYENMAGEDFEVAGAPYLSKNGFVYYVDGTINSVDEEDSSTFQYMNVYIDVNGADRGPNTLGRDLFLVVVDADEGKVYAKGSNIDPSSDADNKWGTLCTGDPEDATACAGSIVDNGGKIMYNW